MLSDTRLIVAPPGTTCEIHRQCSLITMQRGKTRFIYNFPGEAERQQTVTIASMYDYSTKTANLYQSSSPPSPTYIEKKNERSSHFRHKYPGTRQNRGIPKSRKSRKYLQVIIPYLHVPKGTQNMLPAGQSYKPRNRGSAKRRGPAAHERWHKETTEPRSCAIHINRSHGTHRSRSRCHFTRSYPQKHTLRMRCTETLQMRSLDSYAPWSTGTFNSRRSI